MIMVFTTLTRSHSATLVDLSSNGGRLRGDDLPEEGESLVVSFGGTKAFGTIAWRHDGECGVTFDAPLSAPDLKCLRGKAARFAVSSLDLRAAFDDWNNGFAR